MPGSVAYAELAELAPSVDRAIAAVSLPAVGGVSVFIGLVRDHADGQSVSGLDYSAHPSAATALLECAREVAARHDVLRVAVEHRLGKLEVGDLAVVVAVGASHRAGAFDACRDLIDTLKHTVPIWKNERFADGTTSWVGL